MPALTEEQLNTRKRLFARVGAGVFAIGVIGVGLYFAFGAVVGGAASLWIDPAGNNAWQAGQEFTARIMLDTSNRTVGAAELNIQFRSDVFEINPTVSLTQAVQPGNSWSNATVAVGPRVTDTATPNIKNLEFVLGQSFPGIRGSDLEIARIRFRVRPDLAPDFADQNVAITFNTARTRVIQEGASGEDILNIDDIRGGVYTVFGKIDNTQCQFTCAAGEVCPSPEPGRPSCCLQACLPSNALRIDEPTIQWSVIRNTSNQLEVIITWKTNKPSNSIVFCARTGQLGNQECYRDATNLTTDHSAVLTGLSPDGATFDFKVRSEIVTPFEQATSFGTYSFVLQSGDVRKATFSVQPLPQFVQTSRGSGDLLWGTTHDATYSAKLYRNGTQVASKSISRVSRTHGWHVSNLEPGEYTCKIDVTIVDDANVRQSVSNYTNVVEQGECKFSISDYTLDFDANTIVKADFSRECDSWLTCTSSIEAKNREGQLEEMCFAVGVCDRIDPQTGTCLQLKQKGGSSNQFTIAHPAVDPDGSATTINSAKYITGNANIGVTWVDAGGNEKTVNGLSSYGNVTQFGSTLTVPNGTFEAESIFPWRASGAATISGEFDTGVGGRVLAVRATDPSAGAASGTVLWGARAPLGLNTALKGIPYFVTADIRAGYEERIGGVLVQPEVKIRLLYNGSPAAQAGTYPVRVSRGWQTVVVGPLINSASGTETQDTTLEFLVVDGDTAAFAPDEFSLDNISIHPVLAAGTQQFIPRTCRAYPETGSPACDYFDTFSGRSLRGWKGYCLLSDPAVPDRCLQWWPVDVVAGSTSIFTAEAPVGYLADGGRFPLYYCTGARGNYPYIRKVSNMTRSFGNNQTFGCYAGGSNSQYEYSPACLFPQERKDAGVSLLKEIPLSSIAYVQVDIEYTNHGNDPGTHNTSLLVARGNEWSAWETFEGSGCAEIKNWNEFKNYTSSSGGCNSLGPVGQCNLVGVRLEGDGLYLNKGYIGVCDRTDGEGAAKVTGTTVYLREVCEVITQVVDPEGRNRADLANLNNEGYTIPVLGYTNNPDYGPTDYTPFGAAVHPNPDNNPGETNPALKWELLPIEDPDTSIFSTPFQARGGQPYGFSPITDPSIPIQEQKVGSRTCILGAKVGEACVTSSDCGISETGALGVCSGAQLSLAPGTGTWEQINDVLRNTAGGSSLNPLTHLFGKTYGTWWWDGSKYVQVCGESGKPVCSDTGQLCVRNSDCNSTALCGFGRSPTGNEFCGVLHFGAGTSVYGWDVTNTSTSYPFVRFLQVNNIPQVKEECTVINGIDVCSVIEGNFAPEQQLSGTGAYPVTFKFTSHLGGSKSHLPLTGYIVDWGDGEVVSESNLSIGPKEDPGNPKQGRLGDQHTFGHIYQYYSPNEPYPAGCQGSACSGKKYGEIDVPSFTVAGGKLCDAQECRYYPRVQIRDNWDWCNGRDKGYYKEECSLNNENAWTYFGASAADPGDARPIIVKNPNL